MNSTPRERGDLAVVCPQAQKGRGSYASGIEGSYRSLSVVLPMHFGHSNVIA